MYSFFEPVQKSESLFYGSMINTYKETAAKLDLSELQQYNKESISEKETVKENEHVEAKESKTEKNFNRKVSQNIQTFLINIQ